MPQTPPPQRGPGTGDLTREPSAADIRRWRRYLADERAEGSVYRDLAAKREGEEREILLGLASAEVRHEEHWLSLLGPAGDGGVRAQLGTRLFGWFARRFGSLFVLALIQRAESRSPYEREADATPEMAADERIHEEVVRGLAMRSRSRMSGGFRAAVFGANDGLVSNLALVLGIGATGAPTVIILATGLSGLLAGALSMAAGEYVSVRSQRELLEASTPSPDTPQTIQRLDVNANELELVYRARGMGEDEARSYAHRVFALQGADPESGPISLQSAEEEHEELGTAWTAALSSFCFFAGGALLPVLPYIFGMSGIAAVAVSAAVVGVALLATGAIVGVLSGGPPWRRAGRQLLIGFGAAAVTYVLGLVFGVAVG
ncbi:MULTISPECIES: VIT1/CCC1 transporter family protein [unclassified Pseudoclavibacter]|uniref:VIT1/CCC1 transporter family protein n=1 Tax=unclassified Pseudoclavibacter TaxID=2615177 RepID=UPI0012F16DE5|nr:MULTISPECIES: VIT1/CCC1 transporter family protein [unclassified Pseudoclavibacter]MBF4460240.1 VIT1/CCC1 transporter family protein [Pseudoclavibacter sp. VKM Ac-2867]VXB86115.1 Rubrerythrin family protein [Pseudoclavibacter sp. 8L]